KDRQLSAPVYRALVAGFRYRDLQSWRLHPRRRTKDRNGKYLARALSLGLRALRPRAAPGAGVFPGGMLAARYRPALPGFAHELRRFSFESRGADERYASQPGSRRTDAAAGG